MARKYPDTIGCKASRQLSVATKKSAQILGISESEFNRQALEEKVMKVLPDFSFDDSEEQNAEECKEAGRKTATVENENAIPLKIDIDKPVSDHQESEALKKFVSQFVVNKEEVRAKYEPITDLVPFLFIIGQLVLSRRA